MGHSPSYKIYSPQGQYVAACRHAEAAAALANLYGAGSKIKWNHGIVVWDEGKEKQLAGESYDYVAEIVEKRKDDYLRKLRTEREEKYT